MDLTRLAAALAAEGFALAYGDAGPAGRGFVAQRGRTLVRAGPDTPPRIEIITPSRFRVNA